MVEAMSASEAPEKAPEVELNAEQKEVPEQEVVDDSDNDEFVPKSDYKKEIAGRAKLREQRRQLRSQVEELQAEVAKLKGGDKAPDILDYEDVEEYDAALKKHEQQKANSNIPDVVVQARAILLDQHDEWADAPEDWLEVVSRDGLPYNAEMLAMFADLDNGAEVMYSLANDEKALAKIISKISPVKRGLALDEYAKGLTKAEPEEAGTNEMATLTRQQKPSVSAIAPVGGGSKGKTSIESWSIEDHIAAARKTSSF
jgi:hypothetical protein